MRIRLIIAGTQSLLAGLLLLAGPHEASALTIDDFTTAQTLTVLSPASSGSSQTTGSGILGNERDMQVTLNSGFGVTVAVSDDKMSYSQLLSATATAVITWDGEDNSSALDPTGLGGIDFTESGVADSIAMSLLYNDSSASMTLTAYTDASNYSTATASLPGNIPPDPTTTLNVLFSDFSIAAGTGADFSNIGAFSLTIEGDAIPDLDVQLGYIKNPEPSTAALLGIGILSIALMRRRGWAC